MEEHKRLLDEAAKRDHRKVGQDQELFFFHPQSPGAAFFLPNGMAIYNALQGFIREEYWKRGYQEVSSPNMYNSALWKQSGHWQHYKNDMFVFDLEKEQWALKPMNCPGHALLFGHRERSYRELPIRMAEFGILHRNEPSGALTGLTRVRRFTQDDSHIFCTESQVEGEILLLFDFLKAVYGLFGFAFRMKLSTMPDDHLGDVATWERAEAQLTKALIDFETQTGTSWELSPRDGAFYGPKIDITIADALKREFQCATIQLDFQLPQRFNLEYRTEDQATGGETNDADRTDVPTATSNEPSSSQNLAHRSARPVESHPSAVPKELTPGCARPVMIHRAIYGSLERFIAILCEHFGGKWPFWLSPRQILVVPVTPAVNNYALELQQVFRSKFFRVEVDTSGDTMGKKIVNGRLQQFNFIFIVGAREVKACSVNIRDRDDATTHKMGALVPLDEAVRRLTRLRDERRLDFKSA